MKLSSIEKDKQPSQEILRLFEKVRVAYLSARNDPSEYGGRWRSAIELIKDSAEEMDATSNEMKDYLDYDLLESEEGNDPTSLQAKKIFESIKMLRYSSDLVQDPFAKRFKGKVLEALLENPDVMVKFVHYALREDDNILPDELYAIKDMSSDNITLGLKGLDLESDDVALYIIEHYGDGKDSKSVEKKVKSALDMLELLMLSRYEQSDLDELIEIDGFETEKKEKSFNIKKIIKSEEEKSLTDFIVPNKPMYRIFDIEDINELKGFSGDWFVQEKYDGMRIQLQKIDNNVKIFSYNKKDITEKCKEIVKELKEKQFGSCILDAELILFDGDEPLHRADTIAHVFKNKYPDAKLKCHVFDIMRHDEQNLLDEELSDRMTIMFNNYSMHSSDALNFPSKKDTRQADNLKDVEEYSKDIMEMPTSEGVVIKDSTSTYYLGTRKNPKWIKWKKFVDLDVIVLDKSKTKSNLYSYTLGISTTEEEGKFIEDYQGKKYMNVGKALNTKINVDIGSIIRVKVDEVKRAGDRYTLFSAKVIEIPEVTEPDKEVTLELLAQDTKKSLNYSIDALKKGIVLTDHIHGETTVIAKSTMDGFTVYGFEKNNLMSKNAIKDLDMWKQQVEEIMKTKQSLLTNAIFQFLKLNGAKSPKSVHNYLVEKHPSLYEDVLESEFSELKDWSERRDGIEFSDDKLFSNPNKIMLNDSIKKRLNDSIKKSQKLEMLSRFMDEKKTPMTNVPVTIERQKEIPMVSMIGSGSEDKCCNELKQKIIGFIEKRIMGSFDDVFNMLFDITADSEEDRDYLFTAYLDGISLERESEEDRITESSKEKIKHYTAAYYGEALLNMPCDSLVNKIREKPYFTQMTTFIEEYDKCSTGFDSDFSDKYAMLKSYKTPEEYREGEFKIYMRKDNNLNIVMKLGDESINWLVDIQDEEELFDMFGKAGKYPAEVAKTIDKEKTIDTGKVELGVQRHGYHEYFLEGNKFETKLHIRVLPVKDKKMWLAWTGYEQKPVDQEEDKGIWNIYEDKFNYIDIPR